MIEMGSQDFPVDALPLDSGVPDDSHVLAGRYALVKPIGAGGMGEVWSAIQLSPQRLVAIKLIRDSVSRERFEREARALARLSHPGIVAILESGIDDGRSYLVLEHIEGRTLAEAITAIPPSLTPKLTARWIQEAAEAIAHAHEHNILHRDLTPSNLIQDVSGRTRVMDFSLSKDVIQDTDHTADGVPLGTPAYMAPECTTSLGAAAASFETDVYGLGACLYHALTGKPPYQGEGPLQILHQIATDDPDWTNGWRAIHRDLRTICQRAMQRDPRRRYPSARELAEDLRRYMDGEPIHARPPTLWERSSKVLRKPWVGASGVSLGLGLLLAALVSSRLNRSRIGALLQDWPQQSPPPLHVLPLPKGTTSGLWASFTSDGRLFAAGGQSGHLRFATLDPWHVIANSLRNSPPIRFHTFRPGSSHILTVDDSGLCRLWQVEPNRAVVFQQRLEGRITGAAFSSDGRRWILGTEGGQLESWMWNGATNPPTHCFSARHAEAIRSLEFLATRPTALAASADGRAILWDTVSDRKEQEWDCGQALYAATVSPNDQNVAMAHGLPTPPRYTSQSRIRICRIADGAELAAANFVGVIQRIRFSPDGGRLLVVSDRTVVRLYDCAGQQIAQTLDHPGRVIDAHFSPDGLRLLTIDSEGNARLWDAHTAHPLSPSWRGKSGLAAADFAPDGWRIGSGDVEPSGTIWDGSSPVPKDWDRPALHRALLKAGGPDALRRAAWLMPDDPETLRRLAEAAASDAHLGAEAVRLEAEFLRRRAAGRLGR